jgi:uncharacterized protein (DUF305 family)
MERPRLLALATVLMLVLTTAACVTIRGDDVDTRGMHDRRRDGPGDGWCQAERVQVPGQMMGGLWRGRHRMDAGAALSEQEFLVEMVAHHEEAVTAAQELARSERDRMRQLGRSIVKTQSAEIAQMRDWLDEWYDDAPGAGYDPMMSDLSGLAGNRLDRVFLEEMIGHHMQAVMMSHRLLVCEDDLHEDAAELARSVVRAQRAEIMLMVGWLDRWFDARWHGMGAMVNHGMPGR